MDYCFLFGFSFICSLVFSHSLVGLSPVLPHLDQDVSTGTSASGVVPQIFIPLLSKGMGR